MVKKGDKKMTKSGKELTEDEQSDLTDQIGQLYGDLCVNKGLSFREAKRELRETVNSFIGHVNCELD